MTFPWDVFRKEEKVDLAYAMAWLTSPDRPLYHEDFERKWYESN